MDIDGVEKIKGIDASRSKHRSHERRAQGRGIRHGDIARESAKRRDSTCAASDAEAQSLHCLREFGADEDG